MGWKAIARYATGTSHEKSGMPCQDYGHYVRAKKNIIVGAVADGAGSAKKSEIGSRLAVETALSHLKEWPQYVKKELKRDLQSPIPEEEAKRVFNKTLETVVNALKEEARQQRYLLKDLSCTLLAFIATPEWVSAMQIGDGFIVVRLQDSLDYQLLFPPDKGEYANETTFVTSANAQHQMRVRVIPGHHNFICASTDGLERLAINTRDWTPGQAFFQPLEEYMEETSDPEKENEYIVDFLNSERLNTRTDDDKTLLLCLYEKGGADNCWEKKVPKTEKREPSQVAITTVDNRNSSKNNLISRWKYCITQTFIGNILAGLLLHINYDLVAKNHGLDAALAVYIVVAAAVIILDITSALTLEQLRKNFTTIAYAIIAINTCGLGVILGWLMYFILWSLTAL